MELQGINTNTTGRDELSQRWKDTSGQSRKEYEQLFSLRETAPPTICLNSIHCSVLVKLFSTQEWNTP